MDDSNEDRRDEFDDNDRFEEIINEVKKNTHRQKINVYKV